MSEAARDAARVAAPVPRETPALHMPPVQRHALRNGLRILVVEQRDLPVVDLHLVTRTGAAADMPSQAGLTSLTIDLMDEGANGRSALEIADAVEQLGASMFASAGWDSTGLGVHAHAARLDAALAILADIVLRPDFPDTEFARKREQRLNQLLQERDEPRIVASNGFHAALYGDSHAFGRPLNGTRASIEGLTRDHAVACHGRLLRPRNAFLVVVGDVEGEAFVRAAETAFGEWQDIAPVEPQPMPSPTPGATVIQVLDRPASQQSELRIGAPGVPRATPDYFPLMVMNTILGGSFTSRLNLNLRQDKGYTYGAGSSFSFRREGGPFLASTAVGTPATADAVRQVLLEIDRMRDKPVPAEELARAQSYLALGLPRTFETTGDIASHVADLELYGLPDDFYDDYVQQVRAVTVADVQRMARTYLDPSHMTVVVAGDAAVVAEPLRTLAAAPVQVRVAEEPGT